MNIKQFSILVVLFLAGGARADTAMDCPWLAQHERAGIRLFDAGEYVLSLNQFVPIVLGGCHNDKVGQSLIYSASAAAKLDDYRLFRLFEERADEVKNLGALSTIRLIGAIHLEQTLRQFPEDTGKRLDQWFHRFDRPEKLPKPWDTRFGELSDQRKSPGLAGVLSLLLPGAGHIYAGAYQSAAISAVFNGVLGFAAYELWRNGQRGAAGVAGLMFSVTYVGGGLSAAKACRDRNQHAARADESALKRHLFPELP